jgi:hypothetical protein
MRNVYVEGQQGAWVGYLVTADSTSEPRWFLFLSDAQRWAKHMQAKCIVRTGRATL